MNPEKRLKLKTVKNGKGSKTVILIKQFENGKCEKHVNG